MQNLVQNRRVIAGLVVGEALCARAVFVGGPDVAEVTEGDLPFGIGGVAEQLDLGGRKDRHQQGRG